MENAESGSTGPNVTFVGGKAVEQHEAKSSDLDSDTRSRAAAAVKAAMEEAEKIGKETAEDSDLEARVKDPTGTERYKRKAKELEEADGDTKTLKTDKEVPGKTRDESGKFKSDKPKTESEVKPEVKVKDAPAGESEETERLDLSTSTVKQLLKNRDKLAELKAQNKLVSEQNDALAKQRQEVEASTRQIQEVWAQIQQREAQLKAQEEHLQRLSKDPANAVRNLGYDPEDFVMRLAQEGTPEGRARREREAFEARLKSQEDRWRLQEEQQRQWQEQQAQNLRIQARQNVIKEFTAEAFGQDNGNHKYPNVASFYDDDIDGLMGVADRAAYNFRKITGGREASYQDILDYIEDGLATKIGKRYVLNGGQQGKPKAAAPADAPSGRGRSISSDDMVGERKASAPKTSLKDLDADERAAAARAAVKAALKAHQ